MGLLTGAGRAALGWVFVSSGWDVWKNPHPRAATAGPFLGQVRSASPLALPDDVALVRANAATQVVAGAAMGLGLAPRVAAGALIASLVPTTCAGHPFWLFDDPGQRAGQRVHLTKNVGLLGGLLVVAGQGPRAARRGGR